MGDCPLYAKDELREGGLGVTLLADGMVHSVSLVGQDVILREQVPAERYREIAVALNKASKEELRVHRSPFQLGK